MKRSLPLKRQMARLGVLSFFGCLLIAAPLWYTGQIRLVEQVTLPAGTMIGFPGSVHGPNSLRIPAGTSAFRVGGRGGDDVFYNSGSRNGYGYGTHQFDALRQHGTQYHWRLQLGSQPIVGS